jgi:excisionase family DNA binding protein
VQVLVEEEALRRLVQEEVRAGVAAALSTAQAPTGLLRAREAAERLGMSEQALRRASQRGKIPFVKLPSGGCRWEAAAIDAWARSGA